jgi:CSLREA domain-containing protein
MTRLLFRLTAAAVALLSGTAVLAASILVNTADDEFITDGDCSLREALFSANNNTLVDECNIGQSGQDIVTILVGDPIVLTQPLTITEAVTLSGVGMELTTISGGQSTRLFDIDLSSGSGNVIIRGLTLRDGRDSSVTGGAGVLASCVTTLRFEDVRLSGHATQAVGAPGGAIRMEPEAGCSSRLEIDRSIVRDNTASRGVGGAIYLSNSNESLDSVLIERTLFMNNTAGGDGGAIFAFHPPSFAVNDVLFENNRTLSNIDGSSRGGAFHLRASTEISGNSLALVDRASFLFNRAAIHGGAVNVDGPAVLSLRNSTFFDNSVSALNTAALGADNDAQVVSFFSTFHENGDGVVGDHVMLARNGATISLNHSIVANSWETTTNCLTQSGGTVNSTGFNIDSTSGCASGSDDLSQADPLLGGLTAAPVSGAPFDLAVLIPDRASPAVEGGDTSCPGPLFSNTPIDQRGDPRPAIAPAPARGINPTCDIGAIEFQPADQPLLFQDRFEGN